MAAAEQAPTFVFVLGVMNVAFAQRTFLFSVAVIEGTLALLSIFHEELTIVRHVPRTAPAATLALAGFFLVTSIVLGHLAYDLSDKSLYRVGIWAQLATVVLVTLLHRVAPSELATHGKVAAVLAALGALWLTATYRRNLYPSGAAKAIVLDEDDGVFAVVITPRGRSRSPRAGRRVVQK
jgi:hypothetical protein